MATPTVPHSDQPDEYHDIQRDRQGVRPQPDTSGPYIFRALEYACNCLNWAADNWLCPKPQPNKNLEGGPRIAIIGAGITGLMAAAQLTGHGCSRFANRSELSKTSLTHRFHPDPESWRKKPFPDRPQITRWAKQLWEDHGLESSTRFNTRVVRIFRPPFEKDPSDTQVLSPLGSGWYVNRMGYGFFDAVVVATGVCGKPSSPDLEGKEVYEGIVRNFENVTSDDVKGKQVVIVGDGPLVIDAFEWAIDEMPKTLTVVTGDQDIVIPPSMMAKVFGWLEQKAIKTLDRGGRITRPVISLLFRRGPTLVLPDTMLQRPGYWYQRDLRAITRGLDYARCFWLQARGVHFSASGLLVDESGPCLDGGPAGSHTVAVPADLVIMASGYDRPKTHFLPAEYREWPYEMGYWFGQVFAPWDMSICALNCTYRHGLGPSGSWHTGFFMRILLMFISLPDARPSKSALSCWQLRSQVLRSLLPAELTDYVGYLEVFSWFVWAILVRPWRWGWILFVLFGIDSSLINLRVPRKDAPVGYQTA
ncbi:hypothetical protein MCOR02_011649 [Pyricularia oryzae]|uniref:FAD/NAD(P)-binding domain-containing protein n=1 Tax=Pyricularia oryzae TaxID=318829 RepID=A0A4P7N9I5_PYROR|nr:hypothetical protein MCOR02_011649 [Pyricularia oryzae]KAI6319193.1 hypothetical protein MCOR34_003378 [Pyricularia oryzae]KAI6471986.1 hypothetical protein MCOR17_003018 [Pyricularia oryzae]KAI6494704.1 hypothetical protein MCOR13_007399 [Pyricularia oryzae]KAI6556906.1 hypothetical protein MCOR04_010216 [Pyricularia oryzae]